MVRFSSLGIKAKNGVVIATEKKVNTILADENSFQKVSVIAEHVGAVYSGIGPDYSSILDKARKDCMTYDKIYRDRIPTFLLSKQLAELMQEFTQ